MSFPVILAHGLTDAQIGAMLSLSIIVAASVVSLGLLIFSKKAAVIVASLTILAAVASVIHRCPPQLLRSGSSPPPTHTIPAARVIESHAVCTAPALLAIVIAMASRKRDVPGAGSERLTAGKQTTRYQ